jgi:hypothetical protein
MEPNKEQAAITDESSRLIPLLATAEHYQILLDLWRI